MAATDQTTEDVSGLIARMAEDLKTYIRENDIHQPVLIGIHTGGVWVATELHSLLNIPDPLGSLDISFYRDDFTRIGLHPQVKPSDLPCDIDDRHIILIDDVLHTGRTIRAAMNEIFDYGRPASITLAALVERTGRELPIEAAIVGSHMDLGINEHVKLNGPDTMSLSISTTQ